MAKKTIAIIHFNTPELTEACILSIRKHGCDWPVVVFDNSADITIPAGTNGNDHKEDTIIKARPFKQKMKGVKVIDNTKGQVIDFEQFLSLYPDRNRQLGVYKSSVWGSAKHIVTVQKLWELLPDGFILVESDTLIKRDISELWKEQYSFCGYVQRNQEGNKFKVPRILPMLCYMNVPKLTKEGARYFDPDRCWALKPDINDRTNWFDTGACLLDDVLRMRPRLKGLHVDIRLFIEHYGGGSWHQGDLQRQSAWLKQHEALWSTPKAESRGQESGGQVHDSSPKNHATCPPDSAEPEPREAKYTVMTYIFGGYEFPHEVMEKDPDAEYLLITDDPNLKSATWEVICDPSLAGCNPIESNYDVRLHPFRYAHTDVVVRIDGSIQLKKSLAPLLKTFNDGGYDRCLMIHPARNNFEQELECWITQRHYPQEVADRTLRMMKAWGYDLDYQGMFQGCFEIVRNTEKNRDINRLTYHLMKYTGGEDVIDRLDQHIFSFVVNTLHRDLKVLPVSENLVTHSQFAQWYFHNSMRPITKLVEIQPMMFNQPCECWDMPATEVTGTETKKPSKPKTTKRTNSKSK